MVIRSNEEIDQVHKYIEYCMTKYKTKRQTIEILDVQANIDPMFTRIMWDELERQNSDLFKAYYTRLVLIDQVTRYNKLLSQHAEVMQQLNGLKQQQPSASQQAQPMQQHTNRLQEQQSATSQHVYVELVQQQNGHLHHANAHQHPELLHQHNGIHHPFSASQQSQWMHRHDKPQQQQPVELMMQQQNGLIIHHVDGSQYTQFHSFSASQQGQLIPQSNVSQHVEVMQQNNGYANGSQDNGLQYPYFTLSGAFVSASTQQHPNSTSKESDRDAS